MSELPPIPTFTTRYEPIERSTLHLTKEGPVLGCAPGVSSQAREHAAAEIIKWQDRGGLLVLPFPVDVYDTRY